MSVAAYQSDLLKRFALHFGHDIVETEWRTFPGDSSHYAPRIDVAVGPFAYGNIKLDAQFNMMADEHAGFIEALHAANEVNRRVLDPDFERPAGRLGHFNANARCFIAVEIEHRVTRKHLLGGAINAAALGRIAIVVGWTPDKVRALAKLVKYFDFLESVHKSSFPTINIVVLDPPQLMEAVQKHLHPLPRSARDQV